MSLPKPEQFTEFFEAIHGYQPFPWQERLAKQVCGGSWPKAIALPTAAGKTACLDIAVFALACRVKDAPRRIFFVVDRRIVVDQAFEHAKKLAGRLREPSSSIERLVASSLKDWAQDERPLEVYALRGGMYRETAWTRSPLQPTIIASTVDQVGSRLLFRGYGVSDSMKPIHAGLVGNDALILLDEAHCARPFDQTLQAVQHYREWGDEPERQPFRFVSITATPGKDVPDKEIERDKAEDRRHPVLGPRISARKPAELIVAEKARGKNWRNELAKELEKQARKLAEEFPCVAIIVNRVAAARDLADKLGSEAVLVTGRMRPLDRERLVANELRPLFSGYKGEGQPPRFVVGTQCLECGADFDFPAMVTECASLDALRQRFGRLDRLGSRKNAKAVVVVRGDQAADSADDPIYGEKLANTWKWLKENAKDGIFDFGVAAVRKFTEELDLTPFNAPAPDAPVLFPAHLDCWVQTHPIPTPDPDPAMFLHGPRQPGQPDVHVVFRADLGSDSKRWAEIVALCPPSSSEAVSVPISVFKRWLAGDDKVDNSGDTEGETDQEVGEEESGRGTRWALRWDGPEKSIAISDQTEVRPEATYVLPCDSQNAPSLGDFPYGITDNAEEAFLRSRDKAILRLPGLILDEESDDFDEQLSEAIRTKVEESFPHWDGKVLNALTNPKRVISRYPDGMTGFVVIGKKRLCQFDPTYLDDSEPDDSFKGESSNGKPITLVVHSQGVAKHAAKFATACGLEIETYRQAGLLHDLGKLDPRFQAMLKACSPRTAAGEPWAKSGRAPGTRQEQRVAREVHRYPKGARHELLSAALLAEQTDDDLLLHLVATHHGSGRPFADAVDENESAALPCQASLFEYTPKAIKQDIPAWNSELPERFWRMVRKYGWWGVAYREAVFRLADHEQSRREQEIELSEIDTQRVTLAPQTVARPANGPLPLTGLDGANPLAFLAAIGTLVALERLRQGGDCPEWLSGHLALSWGVHGLPQTPVLHFSGSVPNQSELVELLADRLPRSVDGHPVEWAIRIAADETQAIETAIRTQCRFRSPAERPRLDWVIALLCESAPKAASQLQTVRRDYLIGNIRSVLQRTNAAHLFRALFEPWDYADALDNQSLHWEPTEDRRHAYQWHMPSGDPTRKQRGGMLGANRLALEAWPLFPSFPSGEADRVTTRGFRGNRSNNTFWTWPLWTSPLTMHGIGSILSLSILQDDQNRTAAELAGKGIGRLFRSQRILIGKTPNLTPAVALA